MKTILKLTEEEAKAFFIKPESYCNIHLPIYIKFENVIGKVVEELKEKRLSDFYGSSFDHFMRVRLTTYQFVKSS